MILFLLILVKKKAMSIYTSNNKQKTIFFPIYFLYQKDIQHLNLALNLEKIALSHDQFLANVNHFFYNNNKQNNQKRVINYFIQVIKAS